MWLDERLVLEAHLPAQDRTLPKRKTRPTDDRQYREDGTPLTNEFDGGGLDCDERIGLAANAVRTHLLTM